MSAPRHDIYAFIHKGLRAFMAHTLVRVGRLDPHDADDVAEARQELRALLDICEGHLDHENRFVHRAIESRSPGASAAIADEHQDHQEDIAALRALLERVPGSTEGAYALYHALATFVAHNLEHMEKEETAHNAVLWACYSDEEILAIEHELVASIAPQEMQLALRWMLPHMNPAERAAMLGGMRQGAPAAVFEGALGLVRPLLGGRDWRKLSAALAL
jgi:hemerythrin-like domain-containing protein